MKKISAMSVMGYAIVLVIILGIVMIISAPMLVDKYKNDNTNHNRYEPERNYEREDYRRQQDNSSELRMLEDRINSRISELENRQTSISQNSPDSSVSNKYVCTIEGKLDESGIIVPADSQGINSQKFVFVCEYRQ